jgi:hypothetical protein
VVTTSSVAGPSPVSEGQNVAFIVTTTNVPDGTTLYWTIASNAGDFAITSGSFPINSNSGTANVTPNADFTTEGTETFFIVIRTGSIAGSIVAASNVVTINDTSVGLITSGLQLWLDAGNASSYSGSGVNWNDLSGNGNNGTLVSSPTYYSSAIDQVPCIGFNGANQRVSFTYQTPTQTTSTGFTWTILYYALNGADSFIMMGYRGNTLPFYKLTTQKFEMYPAEVYGPVLRNGWRVVTAVYDGTLGNPGNMKVYHGSEYSSSYGGTLTNTGPSFPIELRDADTPSLLASAMPFYVGGDPIGNEYYNGYINTVLVYNRALTASEVAANYQVLRQKYLYGFTATYIKTASITESPTKTFTTTSGLTWGNDQIYSTTGYTNTAFTSCYFRGSSGAQFMLSLNTDPTTDASYTSLDYAWFFAGFGSAGIWENNVQVVAPSIVYAEFDKFSVEFDGLNIVYRKNGTAVRTVARAVGSALHLDTAFNNNSGAIKIIDLRFGGT